MVISVPGESSDEEKALLEQLRTLQMGELEIVQEDVADQEPEPEPESGSSGSAEAAGGDA
jgi:hypothetical protein